ncbi:MAG: thermonuclease family protein [bacterium]|nr:thermonuclease family protein [bacterium]
MRTTNPRVGVGGNRKVGLELDVQARDRHGRKLAYLWLQNGDMFSILILKEGYAQVLTIPPNVRDAEASLSCEREARQARRGLLGR